MTASPPIAAASPSRTAVPLVAGIVVAGTATTVVAFAALAAGADPRFAPLSAPASLTFTVVGVLAAYAGWRVVRRFARNPAATLRILVPVVLVLSFVPDVVLGITRFIPYTDTTGAVALAIMHVVVAGVAVPLSARLAPVGPVSRAA